MILRITMCKYAFFGIYLLIDSNRLKHFDFQYIVFRHADIIAGIAGFKTITKVAQCQAQALPYMLETNENLCIQMMTGCGKTLLYGIGAITTVNKAKQEPQVLVVCVSYEAAVQTFHVLSRLAIFTGVTIGLATNEIGFASRSKLLILNIQILF